MNLQKKSLYISGWIIGASLFLLLGIIGVIVLRGFGAVEYQDARESVFRARQAIESFVDDISVVTIDWAHRRESRNFLKHSDREILEEGLTPATLARLNFNVCLMTDREGRVVHAIGYDSASNTQVPVPPELLEGGWHRSPFTDFSASCRWENAMGELGAKSNAGHEEDQVFHGLGGQRAAREVRVGLVSLPDGVMALSAAPIREADPSKEPQGTIFFGKWFDGLFLQKMSRSAHARLDFVRWQKALGEKGLSRVVQELATSGRSVEVRPIDASKMLASFALEDYAGQPVLLGTVRMARPIHAQALDSLCYISIAFLAVGVVCLGVVFFVIRRVVLKKLMRLASNVRKIGWRDLSDEHSVIEPGDDEISELSREISNMLDRIFTYQQQLDITSRMAEEANQAKSNFLANMSHEIRTPMTAILGFLDLLVQEENPQERESIIWIIRQNGQHLLDLINDILDLSSIESEKIQVQLTMFELIPFLDELFETMLPEAERKGLHFTLKNEGEIPSLIQSDPFRLKQILINLINNALKFTDQGEVNIVVRTEPTQFGRHLAFDIHDTGVGIDEEDRDKLFRPFTQVDVSATREYGGSGLGLSISRRLAELLGGSLTFESAPGEGSVFTVTIDPGICEGVVTELEESENHHPLLPVSTDQGDTGDRYLPVGTRILVAEDFPPNQSLIEKQLLRAGADVICADDGKMTLKRYYEEQERGTPVDLILMDMQMPVMNGFAATRQIRTEDDQIPIVALTARALSTSRQECLACGCSDYVSKPIDWEELFLVINQLLAAHAPETT